jgi:hypothetical protein
MNNRDTLERDNLIYPPQLITFTRKVEFQRERRKCGARGEHPSREVDIWLENRTSSERGGHLERERRTFDERGGHLAKETDSWRERWTSREKVRLGF